MAVVDHTASGDANTPRICRTCRTEYPQSNFGITNKKYWKLDCKSCQNIKSAERRRANPEKGRALARAREAKTRLKRSLLTQAELKKWVSYEPDTGLFSRIAFKGRCRPGDKVGCLNPDGYLMLKIGGNKYAAHRLAWLYMHGRWPDEEIDHINRIRDDNRFCNLRELTHVENTHNSGSKVAPNKSGYMGVFSHHGKWLAKIVVLGEAIYLGRFDDPAEAHRVYLDAKKKYHPTFVMLEEISDDVGQKVVFDVGQDSIWLADMSQ